MVVVLLWMVGKCFNDKCMGTFSHWTEAKNWYVRVPKVVMTILGSFGRNKSAKSLAFPRNVPSNVNLDTKNHILVKGTSKYCRCKHCNGRSIDLCRKCNVALHPDYFKDYHSWNTKLYVLFPTGSANNVT